MFTSFNTALSALNANATAIDIVGNNLANLNTSGFKASTVSFHDLVTQSLGGAGETQVGFGVGSPVTLRQFAQGAIQSTGGPLDAAVQGDGFFIVRSPNGVQQYTRSGNFVVDTAGNLTTATGEKVLGWNLSGGVVDPNSPIGEITLPVGSLKTPQPTTTISADMNLDATAPLGPPPGTFSTAIEVYDSLGTSHIVNLSFTKTAANQWQYSAGIPDADVKSPFTPVTGTLTFDGSGNLVSPAASDQQPVLKIAGLADGAADLNITWNFYNGQAPRISQFAQKSATSALAQDGSAAANLVSVGLADGGAILAKYSNGTQVVAGQLAMATIRNPQSLLAVGDNAFETGARTALPAIGLPGTGGRGTILGGSIEASTADIAREFTNLIVFQRGYQANARVITTVDQMSQETVALKQ
ncbi:MAG: flagellar hook protein FlgE [Acidobacteria bacterium]|jgi:flagellar hook protein FlgE|nr:MAG: flagellar hook protein FlgE [Acidobacteriota bacterium]